MKLKELTLFFETCDSVTIPAGQVSDLEAQHAWETITSEPDGSIKRTVECGRFTLKMAKEAGSLVTRFATGGDPDGTSLSEKLQERNVVGASLAMDGGDTIFCTFPWRDDGLGGNDAMEIHTGSGLVFGFTIS